MRKLFFLFLVLVLLIAPGIYAKQGHMKLLAVKETENGAYEGGTADLYLEIKPGSGRVFLETFPLTKTDTQMSTRFAKAIACDIIEKDCDDVDFFYTITADSAIIAGPSAGASIAVLTASMLEDIEFNDDYAITGTINSGGLIGPVGGLKAKVEAAKANGLKKVFIPAGELIVTLDNTTTDLKNLSRELDIDIIEVSTLTEAIKHFTGKDIKQKYKSIDISEEYKSTMKTLARDLCDRSAKLRADTSYIKSSGNISALRDIAYNLTSKGREAFEKQTFYSSASYCFGANVEYVTLIYNSKNLSKDEIRKEIMKLYSDIRNFENEIESRERKTITDLEAYIVIKERLSEAYLFSNQTLEALDKVNNTERLLRNVAYASERLNSARSWSKFLGKDGKIFNLNKEVLKKSCQAKISEADERQQYVELYFPGILDNIKDQIRNAETELEKGNYELCLSKASKAKADVDIILNVFGVDKEQVSSLVERKLEIVKNNLAMETAKGIFPILGYSYYEYANSLKDSDPFSALIYSEYALELGNLDIYFKELNGKKPSLSENKAFEIDSKMLLVFFTGAFAGAFSVFLIKRKNETQIAKARKKNKKK